MRGQSRSGLVGYPGNERVVKAEVGTAVQLDSGRCELLLPGDEWVDAGFPGCDFRFPNPIYEWREKHAIACNVHITGRSTRQRNGSYWVRCKVEWIGDCGPNTTTGGWAKIN